MKHIVRLTALACLALFSSAQAAVLVGWDPSGLAGSWPDNWTTSEQGGTVTVDSGISLEHGLDRGAGTTVGSLNNGWGANGVNQTTQAAAITDNDYLYFALAPGADKSMSLSALDFNVRLVSGPWNSGAARYLWQYKVGDGEFTNVGSALALQGVYDTNGVAQPTLDLSGITALQNVTETVEFRVYAWGTGGQFVFGRLAGNDLALSGTVSSVPEPSRMLLLVIGLATLAGRRRRPHTPAGMTA